MKIDTGLFHVRRAEQAFREAQDKVDQSWLLQRLHAMEAECQHIAEWASETIKELRDDDA